MRGEAEAEPLKIAPPPQNPSVADVEEHRVTHIPFRSWCRGCVEGRALGEQLGDAGDACGKGIVVVGMDYSFNAAAGVRRLKAAAMKSVGVTCEDGFTKARAEGKITKNILTRCSNTKLINTLHRDRVQNESET